MTLRDRYELSIQIGVELDVRGEAALRGQLAQRRREFEALPDWQKPYYDQEHLRNPFGDVRITNGPEDVEMETILLGIDIIPDELLLSDRPRSKGRKIDAVIAHHTHGVGVASSLIHDFMPVAMLGKTGVNTVLQIGCTPAHAEAAQKAGVVIRVSPMPPVIISASTSSSIKSSNVSGDTTSSRADMMSVSTGAKGEGA